jgi:hypothetical protein
VQGGGSFGGNPAYNFYTMFCAPPNNKPFAVSISYSSLPFWIFIDSNQTLKISETGAAFYEESQQLGLIDPGPGHLAIAQSYWRQFLTNTATLDRFPKLKFISIFEFEKPLFNAGDWIIRDYRITTNQLIAQAFINDFRLSGVVDRIVRPNFKQFVAPVRNTPGSNGGPRRNRGVKVTNYTASFFYIHGDTN